MNTKFTNALNDIKIASPCSQDWNEMIGGERQRFCGECKLNVYNLSGMTRAEAENLVFNAEGRLCVRFYKRSDGTILTEDCPIGWQAIKRRVSKSAAAFASLVFGVIAGLGFTSSAVQSEIDRTQFLPASGTPTPAPLMGSIAAPPQAPKEILPNNREKFMMGEIAITKSTKAVQDDKTINK